MSRGNWTNAEPLARELLQIFQQYRFRAVTRGWIKRWNYCSSILPRENKSAEIEVLYRDEIKTRKQLRGDNDPSLAEL